EEKKANGRKRTQNYRDREKCNKKVTQLVTPSLDKTRYDSSLEESSVEIKELQIKIRKPSDEEMVYAEYPRKVGLRKALEEIKKARDRLMAGEIAELGPMSRDDALKLLLDKTVLFAQSPKAQGEYCPHPSTFYHQSRYLDDEGTWYGAAEPSKADRKLTRDFEEIARAASALAGPQDGRSPGPIPAPGIARNHQESLLGGLAGDGEGGGRGQVRDRAQACAATGEILPHSRRNPRADS